MHENLKKCIMSTGQGGDKTMWTSYQSVRSVAVQRKKRPLANKNGTFCNWSKFMENKN